ncbi:unnamed protein product [Rotaria sp. Silwood1]|nr:unnamed protein product [Rotaria sp. Silwood1]CAF3522068.1 unnamed protein product [Rotaria sp. Silwood1]CAF3649913.1 unnamed protein product [Rotaria sp. Silwood1]CAF4536186.1 unnamed protein product [Rotaria sp. Silwood1]CAF4538045.1 unnamed protein product [Rotaria sp. Silwood1]
MMTSRSNEILPIGIQSSLSPKPTNKSTTRNNLRLKRNLRDKRRSTGIHPDEVSVAGISFEDTPNEDDEDEEQGSTCITETNELFDHNRTMPSSSCSTPIFTVRRIQPSFENLSISEPDSHISTSSSNNNLGLSTKIFRPEEFIVRRVEQQTSDVDSVTLKFRQFEERILALESLVYEKDTIIHDLQRKIEKMTRDLTDAEEQIYRLHQEKLTLIKAFSALQDNKPLSGDVSIRSNLVTKD